MAGQAGIPGLGWWLEALRRYLRETHLFRIQTDDRPTSWGSFFLPEWISCGHQEMAQQLEKLLTEETRAGKDTGVAGLLMQFAASSKVNLDFHRVYIIIYNIYIYNLYI